MAAALAGGAVVAEAELAVAEVRGLRRQPVPRGRFGRLWWIWSRGRCLFWPWWTEAELAEGV